MNATTCIILLACLNAWQFVSHMRTARRCDELAQQYATARRVCFVLDGMIADAWDFITEHRLWSSFSEHHTTDLEQAMAETEQ